MAVLPCFGAGFVAYDGSSSQLGWFRLVLREILRNSGLSGLCWQKKGKNRNLLAVWGFWCGGFAVPPCGLDFPSVALHRKHVRKPIVEKWKGTGRGFGLTGGVFDFGCGGSVKLHPPFSAFPLVFRR